MTVSRAKGASGEREVARLIREWLGFDVKRNWQAQSAEGGADLTGVPGWAIEVKRAKVARLREWWVQTIEQAQRIDARPALIYRIDGAARGATDEEKWIVVTLLAAIGVEDRRGHLVSMTLAAWMDCVRNQLETASC